ncbi:MAG: hypothetical protein V1674_01200 [Candidatus Omnitrophota bacterium]
MNTKEELEQAGVPQLQHVDHAGSGTQGGVGTVLPIRIACLISATILFIASVPSANISFWSRAKTQESIPSLITGISAPALIAIITMTIKTSIKLNPFLISIKAFALGKLLDVT